MVYAEDGLHVCAPADLSFDFRCGCAVVWFADEQYMIGGITYCDEHKNRPLEDRVQLVEVFKFMRDEKLAYRSN